MRCSVLPFLCFRFTRNLPAVCLVPLLLCVRCTQYLPLKLTKPESELPKVPAHLLPSIIPDGKCYPLVPLFNLPECVRVCARVCACPNSQSSIPSEGFPSHLIPNLRHMIALIHHLLITTDHPVLPRKVMMTRRLWGDCLRSLTSAKWIPP